jgi:hypothetical protein
VARLVFGERAALRQARRRHHGWHPHPAAAGGREIGSLGGCGGGCGGGGAMARGAVCRAGVSGVLCGVR